MKIGEKFRVKEGAVVMSWTGPVRHELVKDKIGEYIGINSITKKVVLDFGAVGPFNMTCDVDETDLQPVMFRKVFEGVIEYDKEDGGQALIATIVDQTLNDSDTTTGMMVRVQSWDESEQHVEARQIEGKRVRVTVEEIS